MINEEQAQEQEQETQTEQETQSEDQTGSHEQEQEQREESTQQSRPEPEGKSNEERAAEIDHIMSMAETDPSIKELPEYQAMVEEMKTIDESKTQVKSEDGEPGDEGKELEEDEQEEEEEESDSDVSSEKSEGDDPFNLNKKKGKSKYKFKDEKEVVDLIKKKGFKEVPTFFESVDKWRNDSQKFVEVQEKNEQIEQGLSSLPTPIKNAIQAYSNSEDWRSAFQSSTTNVDFAADFKDNNKEEIVKHYFKDKYTKLKTKLDEDVYDEEEYNERIEDFYDSSERLFDSDKQAIEQRRAEIIDKQSRESEEFKTSAISSVKALKEKYPDFSSSQLQKIRQTLINRTTDSLFVDDNKYSIDAAERVGLALFGREILEAREVKAKRAGGNESKEEYFERGNKKMKAKGSQQSQNDNAANNAAKHLQGQFKKDPYS